MRKHLVRVMVIICALVLTMSACVTTGGGNGGGVVGDVYQDYSADKQPGGDQFDFDGNYTAPELTINGLADDEVWANTDILATFGHGNAVTVRAYRGEKALFFLFNVSDVILLTEGETNDDAVTRSDSIEFYLDTKADGGNKPQNDDYQINLGIHGKTRIMQGSGSGWGNWNGLIDYEVTLDGVLNDGVEATDTGYVVEVMIPYAQINIERDATIAIAFGQVDKFGLGSTVLTDWDWAGWTYGGMVIEPQTPNNYVLLDKDNNLLSRDSEERAPADMAGYVLDADTQVAIEGATVTTQINGETVSIITDAQGYFEFKQVNPEVTYEIQISKQGYFGNSASYTRSELREANGGRVLKNITLKNEESAVKTTLTGTVKNIVNGAIGGVTVSVEGTSLTTVADADGKFTLEGVPSEGGATVILTKSGYGESYTSYTAEQLTQGGVSELGDVNINLPYASSGGFGLKNDGFADSTVLISRALTGLEFHFSGTRQLVGHLELYLDTKDCAANRDVDTSCWMFTLDGNGIIGGTHYAGGPFTSTGLKYDLKYNDATGYEALFFIPYTYLDIQPLEVFGISLGQWSTAVNDWDGWGWNGQFRAPETPKTYVRVNALNRLYVNDNNTSMVDLSGITDGLAGVKVEALGVSTTTAANGSWSMMIPQTSEAVVITYTRQGYVPYTTTIEAGYFDSNYSFRESISMAEQFVGISGLVLDSESAEPVEGATVSIVGSEISVVTDASGAYTLSGIPTLKDIVIKVEAQDYATQEITIGAVELASKDAHTLDVSLVCTNQVRYITVKGIVTNVNGPVVGASVEVEGNSALNVLTQADGSFEIVDFPGIDSKINVIKNGYISEQLVFSASSLEKGQTEVDFGTIDMWLNYKKLNGIIADKSDSFAAFKGEFTRSATGIEFRFTGSRAFVGNLELFVDTKTSAGDNGRDVTDYLFQLRDDGTVGIVNWAGDPKNESIPSNMKYTVVNKETAPVLTFTLPYSFFGQVNPEMAISATEVIGIAVGQWHTGVSDWDGWDNFAMFGANGVPFVKPEMPSDYIRLGAHNEVYAHVNNDTLALNEYAINFATGENTDTAAGFSPNNGLADNFYAKVSNRDESGVTFSFITTGAFGKEGEFNEMVLVYFDLGETNPAGWADTNYMLKIHSNGDVYARKGDNVSWWKEGEADKIGTITINNANGVITFDVTVTYEQLGIQASDVFGVAMREASANSTADHHLYDPWFDCYFNGAFIDAAVTSGFVRVAADGSLYSATSNS